MSAGERPKAFPITLIEQFAAHEPWKLSRDDEGEDLNQHVLFTFRSNVMYNAAEDKDPPLHGHPISFAENSFLQVVKIESSEWWIARVLGKGAICGYVPSPLCFFKKHDADHKLESAQQRQWTFRVENPYASDATGIRGPVQLNNPRVFASLSSVAQMADCHEVPPKGILAEGEGTRWRNRRMAPYDLAPPVRPLVLVGPSTPGLEITDKMQNTLISYLCASFPTKVEAVPIDDISDEPTTGLDGMTSQVKKALKIGPSRLNTQQMNAIFSVAASGKMPIIVTRHQNPDMLRRSAVMPIIAFLKIGNLRVFSRLVKLRSTPQPMKAQIRQAEKLNTLNPVYYDIVLSHSSMQQSCCEIGAFVDSYLSDIQRTPVIDATLLHRDYHSDDSDRSSAIDSE